MAAIFGSFCGCVFETMSSGNITSKFLFLLPSIGCTVWIVFQKHVVSMTAYCFVMAVFFGGLWTVFSFGWGIGYVVTTGTTWILIKSLWKTYASQRNSLYQVSFVWEGCKVFLCGFVDTGNFLYEPIENIPVSIMEEKELRKQCKKANDRLKKKHLVTGFRMIPYHSVGTSAGVLSGLIVTNLKITNGKQRVEIDRGIIALSKEQLAGRGHYQILLHPDLINHGRL